MILQFIESFTSSDRPATDLVTRAMRVDTSQTANDTASTCYRGQPAFQTVSLSIMWKTNIVHIARGYVCASFHQWIYRRILVIGSYRADRPERDNRVYKLTFSDKSLRELGLPGKMLADQMLPHVVAAKEGISDPLIERQKFLKGEYWQDRHNWRIRETLEDRTRR